MAEQHVEAVDKYPFVAFVMGSTLLSSVMTSVVAPLELRISFAVNIMVSLTQIYGQWNLCNIKTPTLINPLPALGRLQMVMSLLTPLGMALHAPLADSKLPKPNLCFLLFVTVEICVLSFCWWGMRWFEISSRIHFLRHTLEDSTSAELEEEDYLKRRVELLKLLLDDPIVSAIRTVCCCFSIVATVWTAVIIASIRVQGPWQP